MLYICLSVACSTKVKQSVKLHGKSTTCGKIIKNITILSRTTMETPKKENVQNTSNIMKKCLSSNEYLKALNWLMREQKIRLKNRYYNENNDDE